MMDLFDKLPKAIKTTEKETGIPAIILTRPEHELAKKFMRKLLTVLDRKQHA